MLRRTAIVLATLYGLSCAVALLLVPINAKGWFGMTPDPLAGVFAILLSLPWSLALPQTDGVAVGMVMVALCMAANLAIILLIGRWLARRKS